MELKPVRTVVVGGEEIHYHWEFGRVTLTWENILPEWKMATGLLRVHNDAESVPGDWFSSVVILVRDGIYRLEMYHCDKGFMPPISEFKAFYNHLENELGLTKIGHIRARTGKKLRFVNKNKEKEIA